MVGAGEGGSGVKEGSRLAEKDKVFWKNLHWIQSLRNIVMAAAESLSAELVVNWF